MSMLLAWIPFLEPMHFMQPLWYLLSVPLLIGIAMVHKALRVPQSGTWLRASSIMTAQALLGLIALTLVLAAVVYGIVPSLH
ncbi:MAG: hypothetical protein MK074_08335 [Phycisphaerales bacterium]|nr:hypothetical protein [Phycisphaerales bacterium]